MNKHPKFILLFFISLNCTLQIAHGTDTSTIDLGLNRSQAVVNALDRFRSDGYKTDSYRIVVSQQHNMIEVIFVPRLTSDDPLTAKISDLPEVHYYLDASGKNIIRKLFGK